MEKNWPSLESERFSNLQRKHMETYTYLKTRKKSLPDEKTLKHYQYLGRKNNTFHFGEKRHKIENMALLPAFFINMR